MKKSLLSYIFLISASLLLADISYSQTSNFDNVLEAYKIKNYQLVEKKLLEIDTTKITLYQKATWLYFFSDCQSYLDNHHLAYNAILKSKKLFKEIDSIKDASDANFLAISILAHQNKLKDKYNKIQELIDEEYDIAIKKNDTAALRKIYHRIAVDLLNKNNGAESIKYFKKVITISKQSDDSLNIAYALENIGTVHQTTLNNLDSAMYYTKKVVFIYKKFGDKNALFNNYNNQAEQYKLLKNYSEAINLYLKADSIPIEKHIKKSKIILYENLANAYELNKNYIHSTLYLKKLDSLKGNINDAFQNIEISKIKEQYNNEKLRANNLEIEGKRKQNFNLLMGAFAFIFFGGITAFLIHKNTKRKQKLAEQEKALETQKLATVLKEQELLSIDAMIKGQEKERQRIANDLHDDLGGLMATVKLHFNVLKDKQTPELFDKTTHLIDEAYQKIRSIAHAKNSGVIAKQGLLKAIQNIADKVSTSNKIKIEVVDHGLENRLENSLELTIFRIVQELVTNIIKHAEATESTIHLTNHDESLNIMVEDNGKGFNQSQVTTRNKGMGISSIDKRIEHLNGTMTIESEIDKGTTIIIDIPI